MDPHTTGIHRKTNNDGEVACNVVRNKTIIPIQRIRAKKKKTATKKGYQITHTAYKQKDTTIIY